MPAATDNNETQRQPMPSAWPVYRVIRFRMNGKPRTIKSGLTLAEAQAHCQRNDTHGTGWFDGYDLMKGVKVPRG